MERWASFDCYGTLIDWNAGMGRELERLFGPERTPHLLARYHELEPQVQSEGYRPYRDVLRLTLLRLAEEERLPVPEGEHDALARSLPAWPPFAEVPAALEDLRARGWKLALLSNSDRDLIAASQQRLAVPVELAIVAEDVGSYKPERAHWDRFFAESGAEHARHVHVAQSHFHDVAPASGLGLATVWINRLREQALPAPTRELPDLCRLPDTLDELVPA